MDSEAEQLAWVEAWARRIEALGLSPIAQVLIEMARPFGFVGSQALLLAQPLMTAIVSDTTVERAATLLDSRELLDRLSVCLEGEEN